MKTATKKVLKWIGIVAGVLILLAVALGLYLNSIIPKPIGTPTQLQAGLFEAASHPTPIEGKYIFKSATELAALIRSRQATSEEIVREFLANIHNNNWKYNALIWLRENEALEEARLADAAVAKGDTTGQPLLGVPVTIKEMYWVKGSPSTMNAAMFGFTAPEDAPIVRQLKQAGAIVLGTTNVPYMLGDYQTQGEVYPTANNPYDTTRTPGGSTGGGAAALAAGFSPLELGSDMGGSIRVPAAFCGLWGLKSTYGALNITQGTGPDTITPIHRMAMASAGPLARTPQDLRLMWSVLNQTPIDPRFQQPVVARPASNRTLNQYNIAWMDQWKHGAATVAVSADVQQKLSELIAALQSHGVGVSKQAPDTYDPMCRSFLGSFASMMADGQPWLLRKLIGMDFKKLDNGSPNFEAFFDGLNDASDAKWEQLQTERQTLTAEWEGFFKQHDFFVCPITYGAAFTKCKTGSPIPGDANQQVPYTDYVPYSYIFNATGHPSVVVPLGLNKSGLPIAVQVVGPQHSEAELLHFAELIAPLTPGFVRPAHL